MLNLFVCLKHDKNNEQQNLCMLVVLKNNNKNQFCLYKNFFIIILSYGQN